MKKIEEKLYKKIDADIAFISSFKKRADIANHTNAFRVIDRGEIGVIDCSIDRYGDYLHAWIYNAPYDNEQITSLLQNYLQELGQYYHCKGAVLKLAQQDPHRQGLTKQQWSWGASPPTEIIIEENNLKFLIRLTGSHHPGLFLEHRNNRQYLRNHASGKRVLNLFAYTCSFSLYAVAGDCEVVFSIDSSNNALHWGKENFALNQLDHNGKGKFVVTDVLGWLDKYQRKLKQGAPKFDLIICDPPTFSHSKNAKIFQVEKQWTDLAQACATLSHHDAQIMMSNNHHQQTQWYYEKILKNHFAHVATVALPTDFQRNEFYHHFLCKK